MNNGLPYIFLRFYNTSACVYIFFSVSDYGKAVGILKSVLFYRIFWKTLKFM